MAKPGMTTEEFSETIKRIRRNLRSNKMEKKHTVLSKEDVRQMRKEVDNTTYFEDRTPKGREYWDVRRIVKTLEELYHIEPELKPCPFCGSDAAMEIDNGDFSVGCSEIDCTGNVDFWLQTRKAAIKAWNNRA